jgi:molecular chaperone DnaK
MRSEAEQYAEEDHKRREAAETRNQGEQLAYQTEKFIADNKDKLPEDVKSEVEAAIADLKEKLKNESTDSENTASIREATEKVAAVSQKLGQALYANAPGEGAAQAGAGAGAAGGGEQAAADDDVVDAEIVDEDKRDGAA